MKHFFLYDLFLNLYLSSKKISRICLIYIFLENQTKFKIMNKFDSFLFKICQSIICWSHQILEITTAISSVIPWLNVFFFIFYWFFYPNHHTHLEFTSFYFIYCFCHYFKSEWWQGRGHDATNAAWKGTAKTNYLVNSTRQFFFGTYNYIVQMWILFFYRVNQNKRRWWESRNKDYTRPKESFLL